MSTLKLILGMIPSTSKLEQEEKALITEYEKMISFAGSETLAKYNVLHESINSAGFRQKKKELESLTYKGSEEFLRETEFFRLKKAKDIALYFKTEGSALLKNFTALDGSAKIKEIEDLERFIQSPEFKQKERMKPVTFKDTEEYGKWLEYKKLLKDKEVRKNLNAAKVKIFEELKKIEKPVVVSVGDICASGAYYISCAADRIVANRSSSIGSIGVIMRLQPFAGPNC